MKWIMGIGLPTILILLGVMVLIIKSKKKWGLLTKRIIKEKNNEIDS